MEGSTTHPILEPRSSGAAGNALRRLAALLFGLTYFGWVIVCFAAYQWAVGGLAGLESTSWYHIEGEPVLYAFSFGLAAIVVLPLVVAILAGHRRLPMTAALVIAIVHVPLFVWYDDGHFGGVFVLVVGLDVSVVAVVCAWLRRVRGVAPGLAF